MASATLLGYGSIPGSRTGSRPQSPALNATNGMDKASLRAASPYSFSFDKDKEKSGLTASSSGAHDADRPAERNGEQEIDSVSNYSGSRRSSFDFQAILKKYNIRLDDEDEQPANGAAKDDRRVPNGASGSTHASRPQTPQLGDSASHESAARRSVQPNASSSLTSYGSKYDSPTTISKYDSASKLDSKFEPSALSSYDSGARQNDSHKDADSAYNAPQIRSPLVPKRTTPLPFGSAAQPSSTSASASASATANYPSLAPNYGGSSGSSQTNYAPLLSSSTVPGSSYGGKPAAASSSPYAPLSTAATFTAHSASASHDDNSALNRQLADRDAECASLRRQLEDERERVRRAQSELATARAAAATQQRAQTDPALTAKSIELETMRDRYEELLAEKTGLEETVERLQRELEAANTRSAAQPQPQSAPRRRYDDESSSDEQEAQRPVPHLNLYDPNGPEALKRKISELESHVHDLQEANEAAALALQRRERELSDMKREYQRAGSSLQLSSTTGTGAAAGQSGGTTDAWKREADTLRDRNRAMVEENASLREQLLSAKKAAAAASAAPSATASSDSLRYYQSQLSDARETIRKLQDQLFAARATSSSPSPKPQDSTALRSSPYQSVTTTNGGSGAPRSSSPSAYLRGSVETRDSAFTLTRGVPPANAESDAEADADAEQSDSNSTNVLLNAAARVPFSLVDFSDKDLTAAEPRSTKVSGSASQFDLNKYDSLSLSRKYDRPSSPTRATVTSSYSTSAATSSSPAASKPPSYPTSTSVVTGADLYSKRSEDLASRHAERDRDRDRDSYMNGSSKADADRDRSWLKTDFQSRSLRSSPVVVTPSWSGASHAAGEPTSMRASAFDLHASTAATASGSRFGSSTSPSAFRSPFTSSKIDQTTSDRSRPLLTSNVSGSHKATDGLLSESDGEAPQGQPKLSAAAISANISRLLDKTSPSQHISGRTSVPVKATLPVSLATSAADKDRLASTTGSAYHELYSDASRRNRATGSETQLGTRASSQGSSSAVQSKYSSLLSSTLGERSASTSGLEHRSSATEQRTSAFDHRNTTSSSYRSTLTTGVGSATGAGNGLEATAVDRRSRPFAPRLPSDVRQNDTVKFCRQGGHVSKGRVMYVGPLPGRSDTYLGVELENEDGKHDGVYEGSRYFKCKPNKGVFVAFSKVILVY